MVEALQIIIVVLAIEAITEIISSSAIFEPLRLFFYNKKWNFLHSLSTCGYCTSVWVSMPFAVLFPFQLLPVYSIFNQCTNIIISVFFYHRLSNVIHESVYRVINRIPFILFLNKSINIYGDEPEIINIEEESDGNHRRN